MKSDQPRAVKLFNAAKAILTGTVPKLGTMGTLDNAALEQRQAREKQGKRRQGAVVGNMPWTASAGAKRSPCAGSLAASVLMSKVTLHGRLRNTGAHRCRRSGEAGWPSRCGGAAVLAPTATVLPAPVVTAVAQRLTW
jgi:hypothetical protein